MKKSVFCIGTLFFLILFLIVVQVTVSNKLSTTGILLGKIQDQVKTYQKENLLISEQLLVASSFTQIASNSAMLGMIEGKSNIILSSPLPLALKQ